MATMKPEMAAQLVEVTRWLEDMLAANGIEAPGGVDGLPIRPETYFGQPSQYGDWEGTWGDRVEFVELYLSRGEPP